jgi:hypothetical protein
MIIPEPFLHLVRYDKSLNKPFPRPGAGSSEYLATAAFAAVIEKN